MLLKNTKENYGLIAKAFHWPTAIIIMALILVGLYMGSMENGPDKLQVYMLHKSFGLLVLWLVGLRIVWRLINKQPAALPNHKPWERILAKLAHLALYIAMIGMPLSGWIMSSAGQHPVPFFGISMPDIVGPNRDLGHLMHEVHEILAFTLIGVIGLHALGALKHHFIDKDSTLTRMMAGRMNRIGPYVLIIILGLFGLGVIGLLASEDEHEEKEKIEKVSMLEQPAAQQGENAWEIAKDQSTLQFRASVYGREFTGNFANFGGQIIFDPDNLAGSVADITIDTRSISSNDEERDGNMIGEEWFDVAVYPTAHFKTTSFEKKDDNNYVAVGELTIKNHSMPVMLPFKLDIVGGQDNSSRRAYVDGSVTLNRLDFGLGEGRWETADSISLDTVVDIKLVAKSI